MKLESNNNKDSYNKLRLQICVYTNVILFIFIVFIVYIFSDKESNSYLRYGPHQDLNIFGLTINTWMKYSILQLFLGFIEITNVLVNDIASPILGFNIYNPDKKQIKEFGRNELQFYANLMWLTNSLRNTLMVLVTISQIDIAILRTIYSELATFYTIRLLLNDKIFPHDNEYTNISQKDNNIEMSSSENLV